MKKMGKTLLTLVCVLTLLLPMLPQGIVSARAATKHPVITMNAPYRNMSTFLALVHEKYPEINLEIIPYNGYNTTAYMNAMRRSGELTDIYFSTYYSAGSTDADEFLDLSGCDFTNNFVESRLREVINNGGIYMLPLGYNPLGITYNMTLLEEHGWKLPTSLKELEELAPQVAAAGVTLSRVLLQYPGFGFQFLCNIADTSFLSTLDGLAWQRKFLAGEAKVSDTPGMVDAIHQMDRWREIGMLNADGTPDDDDATQRAMAQGNILFLLGNSTDVRNKADTTDEFNLMPYLSEDGDQNVFILNVSRYVGLNKRLGEKGNEQQLEDALHVMEVLSTVEGLESLDPTQADARLLPLKAYTVEKSSYYSEVLDVLNSGYTAPFIYSGWETVFAPLGETMISYVKGEISSDDVIAAMDESQSLILDNSVPHYTTVTETLDTEDCAELVGICFTQATNADVALVSRNTWVFDTEAFELNTQGVNGSLFPLPVTDEEIVSILPTGWRDHIQTVTLTGARIKELAETGYNHKNYGNYFPYTLVTRPGVELDDDTVYTAVICGATDEVKEEGNIQDSGVQGLEAMEKFLSQFETLSKKDIVWKE